MKSIGIDYGVRKLAVAALSSIEEGAVPEVFSCFWDKKTDRDEILMEMLETVEVDLNSWWENTDVVSIEYPFFINSRQTAIRMSMVAGTLMSSVRAYNRGKTVFVEPAKWKREVVGYARADKNQTMEFLNRQYPSFDFANDDEADALCLALHGYYTHEQQSTGV